MKNASAYFDKNGLHEIEPLSISLFAKTGGRAIMYVWSQDIQHDNTQANNT
jgi:hypothetical protein